MKEFTLKDVEFMNIALRLAQRGINTARPNPSVGCIIVDSDNQIVGQGWHARTGEGHAEVLALSEAKDKAKNSTVYITLEPCSHHGRTPPCVDQLITAGVDKVIFASEDPNPLVSGEGAKMLIAAGIQVKSGLLSNAAIEINRGFFSRMQRGRPWVRSKLAVSLDGRTALKNGVSKWITSESSRQDVHRWRARSGAILSGIGTLLADNPSLNVRHQSKDLHDQPLRVLLDSGLRIPGEANFLSVSGPKMVMHCRGEASMIRALKDKGVIVKKIEESNSRLNLNAVMKTLAEVEINDVWVEAGSNLNGELLNNHLIDELIVYQAANILGSTSKGMFNFAPLEDMQEKYKFELTDIRKVGSDLRLSYKFCG
ncbi:MAG: bifunctional diaminohydroxyphosphoribosylaminopyrimidine deaminase/5-amino-6-(5-phosphoribosylamino)uracil reductase RibD [Pseudomonadota bacterium]|nr:bifunctional diaminohydroxyphosphoribosylaminopyrimidine deaminase/5-amino-6-(5-phosphoribosylamino)uracil reductase RibD [Pseudomonadota bacterium]